jgi:hypothetical protein
LPAIGIAGCSPRLPCYFLRTDLFFKERETTHDMMREWGREEKNAIVFPSLKKPILFLILI